ncbi:porin [Rhizobium sp. LC145]|jgi:hypothetical protein|uniref:porin n=1 Tax=Rhizobium sp. LC145 TaxID=1120688 RepID=UPI00062A07EF|nr:porin [Rhizobium sp. LC145]KKX34458.1 membrane protein [Rhizobium sp. LC145]TKT43434.1 porin [Rhizobiaceae bacterium LC148]
MNIKSLLLGSAAALAAVSGAQAADAIVAAEPEPMEYVRVCDAFGEGYFYIPGTETCLKVGGYVRFQVDYGRGANGFNDGDWDAWTRGRVAFTSKSDTELGELTGFIAIHGESSRDNSGSTAEDNFYFDEVYLQLGGFKAGTYLSWWDNDLPGELDFLSNQTRFTSIAYIYSGDAFTAGLQVDELSDDFESNSFVYGRDGNDVGLEGVIQATLGPATLEVLGSYDFGAEDGAVRVWGSVEVGPGTLHVAGIYASGANAYYTAAEATVSVAYAFKATDKLEIIPEFQYFWDTETDADGDFGGENDWAAGATVNYQIVEGLTSKVSVGYHDVADTWSGIVRLQRDF